MKSARNRKELEQELKKKSIDVLFRQNDTGRIYGVTFIDHENRTVLNGSRLGKDFSANVFNDLFSGSRTLTGNNKQEMQEHTGYTPTTFVYPFGAISDAAVPIVRSLGFSATLGCASKVNQITQNPECLYELGRFLRPPGKSSADFFRKIAPPQASAS